jgi:hypothetical protein
MVFMGDQRSEHGHLDLAANTGHAWGRTSLPTEEDEGLLERDPLRAFLLGFRSVAAGGGGQLLEEPLHTTQDFDTGLE